MPASETRRATLEAIAYGDDQRVTPADRLRALEQLGDVPDDQAVLRLAAEVNAMTEEELNRDLAGHAVPGEWDQEHIERLVANRTRGRVRRRTKALRDQVAKREAELDAEVSRRVEKELKRHGRGPTEEDVVDGTAEEIPITSPRALPMAPPGIPIDDPSVARNPRPRVRF